METNKEITLSDIADLIKASASETIKTLEAKIESSNEELATMTQKQFLQLDRKIEIVKTEVAGLKTDVARIDTTVNNIEANLNKKVDKIDHNTLDYRVEKLEEKFA